MSKTTIVLLGIVGVALVAVLVSKNAQTSGVLNAGSSSFVNAIKTALSPLFGSSGTASSSITYDMGGLN